MAPCDSPRRAASAKHTVPRAAGHGAGLGVLRDGSAAPHGSEPRARGARGRGPRAGLEPCKAGAWGTGRGAGSVCGARGVGHGVWGTVLVGHWVSDAVLVGHGALYKLGGTRRGEPCGTPSPTGRAAGAVPGAAPAPLPRWAQGEREAVAPRPPRGPHAKWRPPAVTGGGGGDTSRHAPRPRPTHPVVPRAAPFAGAAASRPRRDGPAPSPLPANRQAGCGPSSQWGAGARRVAADAGSARCRHRAGGGGAAAGRGGVGGACGPGRAGPPSASAALRRQPRARSFPPLPPPPPRGPAGPAAGRMGQPRRPGNGSGPAAP